MEDAVRISEAAFRQIYEDGFRSWFRTYDAAIRNPAFPAPYLSVCNAFRHYPHLWTDLRLQHNDHQLHAAGISIWRSGSPPCKRSCFLPAHFEVGIREPLPLGLSIAETPDCAFDWGSWFVRGDRNYISVLVLAWSYVLTARWCELMGQPGRLSGPMLQRRDCTLIYMGAKAPKLDQQRPGNPKLSPPSVVVDIGEASPQEARWWAAVLAPGRGWQAAMELGRMSFWTPWAIRVQSGPLFVIPHQPKLPRHREKPPSFSEALGYLGKFCFRHQITDQSDAALAAVLLLPTMRGLGPDICLPAVMTNHQPPPPSVSANSALAQQDWQLMVRSHLDRLMAGSCYKDGINPMLLSVFYNPEIECNAVSPWIQGTLAAIDSLAADKPMVLGRMFMYRQPETAFLWLGVTVLGLQHTLLSHIVDGEVPVDLVSAAWSGTLQSFVQQPVSTPVVVNGEISSADQCRLLFMSALVPRKHELTVPWKPFGGNPVGKTDSLVQRHALCEGHGLQYRGFLWETVIGRVPAKRGGDGMDSSSPTLTQEVAVSTEIPVDYREMCRQDEVASAIATVRVFNWLRPGGYPGGERAIWEHRWFGGTKPPGDERCSDGESDVGSGSATVMAPEEEEDGYQN